jgi:hypothetical protein
MKKPRVSDPTEPMDLGHMRENGVRSLAIQCYQCRHERIMNVDHLPGDPARRRWTQVKSQNGHTR